MTARARWARSIRNSLPTLFAMTLACQDRSVLGEQDTSASSSCEEPPSNSGAVIEEIVHETDSSAGEAHDVVVVDDAVFVTGVQDHELWVAHFDDELELVWEARGPYSSQGNELTFVRSSGGDQLVAAGFWIGVQDPRAWVQAYSAQGDPTWSWSYEHGPSVAHTITTTAAGELVVGGWSDGNAWVVKLDSEGTTKWERVLSEPLSIATAMASTAEGEIILAGGGITPNLPSYEEAWLVKLDGAGELVWQHAFDSGGYSIIRAVHIDAHGDLFVTGQVSDAIWVAKLDGAGELIWEQRTPFVEGVRSDGEAIVTDDCGNVYATGTATGDVPYYGDIWISKYDRDGVELWTQILGRAQYNDSGKGITFDAHGALLVVGVLGEQNNRNDAWLARLTP